MHDTAGHVMSTWKRPSRSNLLQVQYNQLYYISDIIFLKSVVFNSGVKYGMHLQY